MKLLGLIASALALDYDDLDKGKNKGSKRPAKVETFDCGGVAIADAVTAQTNVVVSGCLDFTSNEVTGEEAVREILKMKKPDDGETAVCVFVCAEGFMEAESERMIDWINEERAKKGWRWLLRRWRLWWRPWWRSWLRRWRWIWWPWRWRLRWRPWWRSWRRWLRRP